MKIKLPEIKPETFPEIKKVFIVRSRWDNYQLRAGRGKKFYADAGRLDHALEMAEGMFPNAEVIDQTKFKYQKIKVRFKRISDDYRTNVYEVRCRCGKTYEPPTTMFNHQEVTCDFCLYSEVVDYSKIK